MCQRKKLSEDDREGWRTILLSCASALVGLFHSIRSFMATLKAVLRTAAARDTANTNTTIHELECDYMVVGAGAASLAFVDTLLTELPETKIIMIDKKQAPGGHWVNAYGFVRLHQPSRFYGIASLKLEGENCENHSKHRANKQEILDYFRTFVETKVQSGNLDFYPECVYESPATEITDNDDYHCFRTVDGLESYNVKVHVKLIDGTKGECIIPHDSPLQFPVDEPVKVMTPNQIYDQFQQGENDESRSQLVRNKFVVLGAGKTGIDCVVYLQRSMKIDPENIAWVISRDVWMVNSFSKADPQAWARCQAECQSDKDKAALSLEAQRVLVRLDPTVVPSRFRFPVIPPDELQLVRNVKTVIRRGRVTSIRRQSADDSSRVVVGFGGGQPSWEAFAPIETCVFVHATSPGPFNGLDPNTPIFHSPKLMTLQLLLMGPRTFSMSLLAKLEAGRRKQTLNFDSLRDLVHGKEPSQKEWTENEILNAAIRPLIESAPYRPIITLAIIVASLDQNPLATIDWMKQNRLCFLSVPGSRTKSYEDIQMLCAKGLSLGLSEADVSMLQVLGEKLQELKGL